MILILLGLLCQTLVAWPQPRGSSTNPDSLSWTLYQQGRWNELLKAGKQMHRLGVDYHNLRLRLAVAALETGHYDDAALHLQRALEFNPYNFEALRMLALARLYAFMPAEAGAVFTELPEDFRKGLYVKPGFALMSAHADLSHTQTGLLLPSSFDQLAGPDGLYGSASGLYLSGFVDAGLWMQLKPSWLMYAGLQQMQHNYRSNFAYLLPEISLDKVEINGNFKDFYYRVDAKPVVWDASGSARQNMMYLKMRHAPSHRFQLIFAGSLGKVDGEYPVVITDTVVFTDTARFDMSSGLATLFSFELPFAKTRHFLWQTTDWRVVFGGMVHLRRWSLEAGLHSGRVNDTNLVQLQAGYMWRIVGNARTWQQTVLMAMSSNGSWRPAMKLAAGYWPGQKTGFWASMMAGQLNGMADQWGFVTFNHREKTDLFGEVGLMQQLWPKMFLSARYRFTRSQMVMEQLDPNLVPTKHTKTLISNGITGGLIWNF